MTSATLDLKGRVVLFRMNSEQFTALPESENFRFELLDGEVVMAARPSPAHQYFCSKMGRALDTWVEDQQLGKLFPDTQLTLDDDWSPVPDLLFLTNSHLRRIGRQFIHGPVDLVVEVLSPSDESTDRVTKLEAYARHGIPWYWIVDLRQRQLEEFRRGRLGYSRPVIAPFDEPFQPRLFPGLTLNLASMELEEQ
jgi:Uma2 family endonuclease